LFYKKNKVSPFLCKYRQRVGKHIGVNIVNILVTGTTGNIGSKLVPRLVAGGYRVKCIARDPQRLSRFNWPSVDILQADLLDLQSLERVMQDIDVAYYLVHSMADGVQGYIQRDLAAATNFGVAAKQANIKHIIYLGGLGDCEKSISPHLEARQDVGEILRQTGIPVTEFRAAIVIGSGSMSFEMIRYLTERLPILPTPSWITTLCQPIAIEDLLDYLVKSLDEPNSKEGIFEIGGPDVLSYAQIMRGYAEARHLNRPQITIPLLTTPILAYGAKIVTPLPSPYLRILIEGLRSEVIVRDNTVESVINIELTPYRQAIKNALQRDRNGEVESFWNGAQPRLEPGVTHKDTEGMYIAQQRTATTAPPAAVYKAFARIGGKHGWYYANWLWWMRGWLDELVGGVGMRRGRRDADELQMGDILDGWKVETIEAGRFLRLSFEMKAPGPAWLQFEAQSRPEGGSLLIITAFFEPHGVAGLLYWWSLYPFHVAIFKGMSEAIIKMAEEEQKPI
jgi:uncharacterized protein YbjT (DUF2867 family)